MKTYWGVKIQLQAFQTLALDGDEWSASCPAGFAPGVEVLGTLWRGGRVGPRTGFDGGGRNNAARTANRIPVVLLHLPQRFFPSPYLPFRLSLSRYYNSHLYYCALSASSEKTEKRFFPSACPHVSGTKTFGD
jgi:hypothetical protein